MLDIFPKQLVKNAAKLGILSILVASLNGCSKDRGSTATSTAAPATATKSAIAATVAPATTQTIPQASLDDATTTSAVTTPETPTANANPLPATKIAKIVTTERNAPYQIAIWKDDTGSVVTSKIPALQFAQIEKLLRQLAPQRGVEIRFGTICADSNLPLARINIPEPPVLSAVAPTAPTLESVDNALKLPKLRSEYRKQLKVYQQAEATYKQQVAARDRLIESELAKFKSGFGKALAKTPQCESSDIYGMLKRTDLYLNEPNPTWKQAPRKIALLITDGLETASRKPQPLQWHSQAEMVLVSSGGETGVLKPLLKTTPFESIDGAIRYITAQ